MPSKSDTPDWEMAKLLFCQGAKRNDIAAKAGCSMSALDQRCRRGKWVALRERFNEKAMPQTMSVSERAEVVKQLIAAEVHTQTDHLTKLPQAKNADVALTKAKTLSELSGVATSTFGEMAKPRCLINIALLSSARTIERDDPPQDAIGVEYSGGWHRLTHPDGRVEILDRRDRLVHPHLQATERPPPGWVDSPPTRALPAPVIIDVQPPEGVRS